jgi:hypothetical protein
MRPLQLGLAVAAGIFFSALFAFAWTGPQNTPPNCVSGQTGCDAPINVGTTAQFKNGNIGLYGNLLLAASGGSYLNFGATSGSTGYGIRDNSGTLEFKSTGGTWTNLTNTVTNVLGIGAVSQIKFSDGTTQTTAAAAPQTIEGLPSKIFCSADGVNGNVLMLQWINNGTIQYVTVGAALTFSNATAPGSASGGYVGDSYCNGKTIQQLIAAGRTYN